MSGESSISRVIIALAIILFLLVLIGLLPTVRGPSRHPEPRVIIEIKQLESAIAAFKAKYGVEPPSRLILHEKPSVHPYDMEGKTAHARIEQRTVEYFQLIWPEFPVLTCEVDQGGDATPDPGWVDFNRNGRVDDELDLDGAECLLFFLGGPLLNGLPYGFDSNPKNPIGKGSKRIGPFFEFSDASRIIDRDGDGFGEWIDPLPDQTAPYLYFTSYGGKRYNFWIDRVTDDNGSFQPYYQAGDPHQDRVNVQWYKPQSFQIISPGRDRKYGVGGLYQATNPRGLTEQDADNYTNFSGTKLRP